MTVPPPLPPPPPALLPAAHSPHDTLLPPPPPAGLAQQHPQQHTQQQQPPLPHQQHRQQHHPHHPHHAFPPPPPPPHPAPPLAPPGADRPARAASGGQAPRFYTYLWEEQHTLVYQVEVDGFAIARRADNSMVNGTKLLNLAGLTRGKRDGLLKNVRGRQVVKIGPMHIKGVWVPLRKARELADQFAVAGLLDNVLADDPAALFPDPILTPMSYYMVRADAAQDTHAARPPPSAATPAHPPSMQDSGSPRQQQHSSIAAMNNGTAPAPAQMSPPHPLDGPSSINHEFSHNRQFSHRHSAPLVPLPPVLPTLPSLPRLAHAPARPDLDLKEPLDRRDPAAMSSGATRPQLPPVRSIVPSLLLSVTPSPRDGSSAHTKPHVDTYARPSFSAAPLGLPIPPPFGQGSASGYAPPSSISQPSPFPAPCLVPVSNTAIRPSGSGLAWRPVVSARSDPAIGHRHEPTRSKMDLDWLLDGEGPAAPVPRAVASAVVSASPNIQAPCSEDSKHSPAFMVMLDAVDIVSRVVTPASGLHAAPAHGSAGQNHRHPRLPSDSMNLDA
ncbi:hypothetical protein HK105_201763 [Polyrhizophydium stewartii]|uniref:HTH APSES-type domain-containing protein n=1 Tax=Polyrhizophydium stewartii TaxID=2732419 RepID=A0ABR4NHJ3_9FUNG